MADQQKDQGQGRVTNPDEDRRLKDNGGGQQGQGQSKGAQDGRHGNHGQGQVKDPENDGRLKQNR